MAKAWIDGRPAGLEHALERAAELLAASQCALVAGLGTDIAGARAAIALADRIGAVVDHVHSDALFRELAVVRESGLIITTPNEARLRADTLMLVGRCLDGAPPDVIEGLDLGSSRERHADTPRAVIRLCPGRATAPLSGGDENIVGRDPDQLPIVLAALRARVAGRPAGNAGLPAKAIADLAARLKAARFGVAAWSAAGLDALAIEMLCGLVADLNARTRFAGLPLAPGDNAAGVLQVCGWMSGFPMRTGFGRGLPEHDPWRFDAGRMVAAGETDCVLWISAYRAAAPAWNDGAPMIALTTGDATLDGRAAVQIEVGRPGVDHDGVEHHAGLATLIPIAARRRNETISVADAIGRIAAAIPGGGALP
jgi:formylmethanofuran dehydrogenase subunit B